MEDRKQLYKQIQRRMMCHHSYYECNKEKDKAIEECLKNVKSILLPDEPFKSWEDAI